MAKNLTVASQPNIYFYIQFIKYEIILLTSLL